MNSHPPFARTFSDPIKFASTRRRVDGATICPKSIRALCHCRIMCIYSMSFNILQGQTMTYKITWCIVRHRFYIVSAIWLPESHQFINEFHFVYVCARHLDASDIILNAFYFILLRSPTYGAFMARDGGVRTSQMVECRLLNKHLYHLSVFSTHFHWTVTFRCEIIIHRRAKVWVSCQFNIGWNWFTGLFSHCKPK